jgi:hypothetical protein
MVDIDQEEGKDVMADENTGKKPADNLNGIFFQYEQKGN